MKKYSLKFCIALLIIFCTISSAQEWVTRYNGPPGDDDDHAYAIAVDESGNVYVTGASYGVSTVYMQDYATVKYNASGVEQWVARYNGPGLHNDVAHAIAVDNSGNVYVTGESRGSGTSDDYATVKYNSSGVEQWVARYNGPGNDWDHAYAIAVDESGNVYVTGESYGSGTITDCATVKYNSAGVEQWVARYNGPGNSWDFANAIVLDNSGNVYVTGGSRGSGTDDDYVTIKYNSSGVEQWVARYNGPANDEDEANAIALDNSGNIYITGESAGSGTWEDYATVKYNSSGVEQWVARYNSAHGDIAVALALDNSANVYVTGYVQVSGTNNVYATVKYNSSGVEQWVAQYNGPADSWDRPQALAVDDSGNVYVTGYSYGSGTSTDYTIVQYDSSGVEQAVARYNGPGNSADVAHAIAIDNAGNVYVTGESVGSGTGYDYATIKYIDIIPPQPFSLISPDSLMVLATPRPTFTWESSNDQQSGLAYYETYIDDTLRYTGADTSWPADYDLQEDQHWWYVVAYDNAGNSQQSNEVWPFIIDTDVPDAPILISPIGGVYFSNDTVEFEWSEVSQLLSALRLKMERSSPVEYVLQVDTSLSFSDPVVVDTVALPYDTLVLTENSYFWRVKAYDLAGNQGPFSDPDSFGIDVTAPVIESTTVWSDTSYAGPFEVFTKVTDNLAGIHSVTLHYKRDEDPVWFISTMHLTGTPDWYLDSIPPVAGLDDTVRYYIRAVDEADPANPATDPAGAPANYYWFIANSTAGVEELTQTPQCFSFALKGNPARGRVVFNLALPEDAEITLFVYDVTGRLIDVPITGRKSAGVYNITWSKNASAGVYFYSLDSPWQKKIGKLVLLK